MPPRNFSTTSSFRRPMAAKSTDTSRAVTPKVSPSRACRASSAVCRRVLVGMHPRLRQVPPTSRLSTMAVFMPRAAPWRAAS